MAHLNPNLLYYMVFCCFSANIQAQICDLILSSLNGIEVTFSKRKITMNVCEAF